MKNAIAEIIDGAPGEGPAAVVLWLPPAREHRLAMSLGLIALPRDEYRRRMEEAKTEAELRGCRVKICKARCYAVVYELSRLGLVSEPGSRAAAIALLWRKNAETNPEV